MSRPQRFAAVAPGPRPEVTFRNGVWVILERATLDSFGPFRTEKLARAALAAGKNPAPAKRAA